jgi:hypothetical protein
MTEREARAKRLDEMAAEATGLERGQSLAAEADRLRAVDNGGWRFCSLRLPLLRN